MIPVPGHTRGSACLLYREFLFSGDHIAYSAREARLTAFRNACWYDWTLQTESIRKLAEHRFSWILPGHGGRCQLNPETMQTEVLALAARMRALG